MISDLISNKIDELVALAEVEGDSNALIVLLILQGARAVHDDGLFAKKCQEFAKDVLLPRSIQGRDDEIARQN